MAEILGLRFPSPGEVTRAALGLRDVSRESALRSQIEVSPGSIRFRRTVPADSDDVELGDQKGSGRRAIVGWTLKSRRQMVRSFAALDYAPMFDDNGIPARVTLTYPADWLTVAPSRQAVQRHFKMFERRFVRAWGEPLVALWKLEYQGRGAPHYHLLMRRPGGVAGQAREVRFAADMLAWEASGRIGSRPRRRRSLGDGLKFTQWLAVTWADVVAHPDREQRAAHARAGTQVDIKGALKGKDPKRASIYFSKHGTEKGSKEYQNRPPPEWVQAGIGPGRYWGYLGLRQLVAAVQVDGGRDYQVAKRTVRRLMARTRVWDDQARRHVYVKAMQVKAKPTDPGRHRCQNAKCAARNHRGRSGRKVRRPVNRLGGASGSVCVNDAPALARDLARVVALTVGQDQVAMRPRPAPLARRTADELFYCETCGGIHPLREHRICRARVEGKVIVR